MTGIALRPAAQEDRNLVLAWRNDPAARAASRDTSEVPAADHAAWYGEVLADPDRHLLIAELDGQPVGQVRLDQRDGNRCLLSVAVAAERRGAGLGTRLIVEAVTWLWKSTDATVAEACVRRENRASLHAFEQAGFAPTEREDPDGLVWLALGRPGPGAAQTGC